MRVHDHESSASQKPVVHATTSIDEGRKLVLIPTPSEYPQDPLNWPSWKKYLTLTIICFGSWTACTAPIAHQTGYTAIAISYGRSPTELTYTVSAGIAGLLGGPFLLAPLAKLIGRTAVIFWCLCIVIATQVWAAVLTGPDNYISFTMSRLFSGIFASVTTVMGSGFIMDIFFLHQRGLAFASYEVAILLGSVSSSTIGGFIIATQPWPVMFWWTLGPLGFAALLFAFVVEDTEFAPGRSQHFTATLSHSYLKRRLQFLTGAGIVPRVNARQLLYHYITPVVIGLAPMTMAAGFFILVNFAWAILVATELAVFLSSPPELGGYGFSAARTAAFTLTGWVALLAAQLFGSVYNDRVPIWLSMRRKGNNHGRWHPEDRLWSMLMGPALLTPIGLGIFGSALQYHLHYMVLALGWFLVAFSALLTVPVCVNYVVERFTGHAVEASVVMGAYRQALGLSLSFYFVPWQKAVGVGWLFGTAAFFTVFGMLVVALLAWKGSKIRHMVLLKDLAESEDGRKVTID